MTQLAPPRRAVSERSTTHSAAPVVIGSVMVVTLLAGLVGRLLHRKLSPGSTSLRTLESAVLGYAGDRVLTRLGVPSAVTHDPADVWYYRLDPRDRQVMAVTFEQGRAARVEIVQSPG